MLIYIILDISSFTMFGNDIDHYTVSICNNMNRSYKWLCKDDGSLNISSIKMPFCVQFNDWTNPKPTYDGIHIVHVIFSDIIQDCVFTFNRCLRDGRVRFIVDKNSLDSEYIMQEYVSLGWSITCKPCHDPMVHLQSLSFLVL